MEKKILLNWVLFLCVSLNYRLYVIIEKNFTVEPHDFLALFVLCVVFTAVNWIITENNDAKNNVLLVLKLSCILVFTAIVVTFVIWNIYKALELYEPWGLVRVITGLTIMLHPFIRLILRVEGPSLGVYHASFFVPVLAAGLVVNLSLIWILIAITSLLLAPMSVIKFIANVPSKIKELSKTYPKTCGIGIFIILAAFLWYFTNFFTVLSIWIFGEGNSMLRRSGGKALWKHVTFKPAAVTQPIKPPSLAPTLSESVGQSQTRASRWKSLKGWEQAAVALGSGTAATLMALDAYPGAKVGYKELKADINENLEEMKSMPPSAPPRAPSPSPTDPFHSLGPGSAPLSGPFNDYDVLKESGIKR